MTMADEYIAGLGEAVYLVARSGQQSPKARTLTQSFLRNGVGAAIDIAAGPNPSVAILDLLVLSALQTWAFEAHWMPEGIGDGGKAAVARIRRAEEDIWHAAASSLTDEQLATVRRLVDHWIAEHPDRTVVSLVRFADFGDERKLSTASLRGEAGGLLREVSDATGAIDDARLLGERALWFASRYPYVLGEQVELTAFRLAGQPEGQELVKALQSIQDLSRTATDRLDGFRQDLREEREDLFRQVATERTATIQQAQSALEETVQNALAGAAERIAAQRQIAIDQFFQSIAAERRALLDDFEAREATLRGVMTELRETIDASGTLASELTKTVGAIDRVVARFDSASSRGAEALKLSDVRDALAETKQAAEQIVTLLERTDELAESGRLERPLAGLVDPANGLIDRAFWRGAILIVLLVAGLGLLRLIPVRGSSGPRG